MAQVLNPHYKVRNLLAFNFAGFACISLVVFLLATQPFYLTEVLGVKPGKIGSVIGTLGALDELTSVITAPLLGTLIDRINGWAWNGQIPFSGPRVLELAAFTILGVSFFGYGRFASSLFPDLWFWRMLFAVGVTGCMSIVTVMLHEVNNSDFSLRHIAFWHTSREREPLVASDTPVKLNNGKLAAFLGVSTGLGAIFSVSSFLTLPVRLNDWYPELAARQGLQISYIILGAFAWAAALVVFTFSYDCVQQRKISNGDEVQESGKSYFELLKEAIETSKFSRRLHLAYVGAFVARSTTVATSVFIPLVVYKFYYNSGNCGTGSLMSDSPLRSNCYEGYIFLAILTGVAQTVALISSPLWGVLVDSHRLGSPGTLLLAAGCGMAGTFGLCLLSRGSGSYDPRNALCFVMVSLIGLAQIGTIIASMSLLSGVGQSVDKTEHRVIGSLSGLYSLCGGMGILVITKIGGSWSDRWVFAPFFLLGVFNVALGAVAVRAMRR